MAVYTNATLANITIPLLWDSQVLEARYASAVILARVLNKSQILAEKGSLVYIDVEPTYTSQDVGSNGSFTSLNTAPTQVNITVDKWKAVSIDITNQAEVQSFWDPLSKFPARAGKLQGIDIDTDLGNLYSGVTSNNVFGSPTSPQDFGDNEARLGMLQLAKTNIPIDGLSFILPPSAFYRGLLSNPHLTAAYATGLPKSVLTTGFKQDLLGAPVYLSNCLANDGTAVKGYLLHKEALGAAIQINGKYNMYDMGPANRLAHVGVYNYMYGTRMIRNDHLCVFNILP